MANESKSPAHGRTPCLAAARAALQYSILPFPHSLIYDLHTRNTTPPRERQQAHVVDFTTVDKDV